LAASDAATETRLRLIEHQGPVGFEAGLKLAAPEVGDAPCVVHLGSGLLGESLTRFTDGLASESPDVTLIVHQSDAPDGHLSAATQEMLHLVELDRERAALNLAGVWLFGPGALQRVASASWQATPDVDLTSIAERVADAGGNVQVMLVDAWCHYAGDPLELLELNRIALDRLSTNPRRPTNNGNHIEGRVWIHEHASVRASVIVGPAVIGPGARVADAYIGPYTSIGAGRVSRVRRSSVQSSRRARASPMWGDGWWQASSGETRASCATSRPPGPFV
jgi:glucose-1-phosphate thymidylyltransferase